MNTVTSITQDILTYGGMTWSPDRETPNYGYMISLKDYEYVCHIDDFDVSVVDAYQEVRPNTPNSYLGAWVHGDNVYLDISLHVNTKAEAYMIADIENQFAVYNLYKNKSEFTR